MPAEKGTYPTARQVSVDEAFAYCAALTNAHYENFPVASLFLPREKRPYIQSIYAFARVADDVADEASPPLPASERLRRLDEWGSWLQQCYENGEAGYLPPVFVALRESVRTLDIPIEPLKDLLAAFRSDVTKNRFATFDELLDYCRRSANPVGRMVLMVFGHRDERLFTLSDSICTGLQLANFWQDISVDFKKNRIYIPQSDLRTFGYAEEELGRGVVDDRFRGLLGYQVERTRGLFYEGADLPSLVGRDLQLELRLVWFGGMSILRKIEARGFDVLRGRPVLHAGNKLMIFLRGLFLRNLARYKRTSPWDLT